MAEEERADAAEQDEVDAERAGRGEPQGEDEIRIEVTSVKADGAVNGNGKGHGKRKMSESGSERSKKR